VLGVGKQLDVGRRNIDGLQDLELIDVAGGFRGQLAFLPFRLVDGSVLHDDDLLLLFCFFVHFLLHGLEIFEIGAKHFHLAD
jgi:hypothetical protein